MVVLGGTVSDIDMRKAVAASLVFIVFCFIFLSAEASEGEGSRIEVLVSQRALAYEEALAGFRDILSADRGGVDIVVHYLGGDREKVVRALSEAVEGRASLIFALGSFAMKAVLEADTGIPVIAGMVLRAEGVREGTNATAVTLRIPAAKQLEYMKLLLPGIMTIGVMYNPEENREMIDLAEREAEREGMKLVKSEINSPRDIPEAMDYLGKKSEVTWGFPDSTVYNPQTAKKILLYSFQNRIPFIGLSSNWVKAGAIYSIDWDYSDIGSQCGEAARLILAGKRADSIPVAQPRRMTYSINLKTFRHMKIDISDELVGKAQNIY